MSRERVVAIGAVIGLGSFVALLLVGSSLDAPRAELDPVDVAELLTVGSPADRYGAAELRVVGWYAGLDEDCRPDEVAVVGSAASWLHGSCPLRVLLPAPVGASATQHDLERGLRLAARDNRPFPPRADPFGVDVRLQPLVFTGHFDDPAAAECPPRLAERCRNTFVVSDHDGLLR